MNRLATGERAAYTKGMGVCRKQGVWCAAVVLVVLGFATGLSGDTILLIA